MTQLKGRVLYVFLPKKSKSERICMKSPADPLQMHAAAVKRSTHSLLDPRGLSTPLHTDIT